MNGKNEIHPYWRALAGATLGFGIGTVSVLMHSFWVMIMLIIFTLVGGIVGVLAISGD